MSNEFETGPVEGLLPIAMRDPRFLQLNAQDKVILATFCTSPAYAVWNKLVEGELEKMETSHFQNWKDPVAFERTGLVAVSARLFAEKLGQEAQRQVEEFSGEIEFVKNKKEQAGKSPEQQIQEEFK